MKPLFLLIPLCLCLASCAGAEMKWGGDSGTFRGNWWNYYDRALERSARGSLADAVSDLEEAIALRPDDTWRARTYGMHMVDYFPHRELGIARFNQGDFAAALQELEASVGQAESAKGCYFLNKSRRELLLKQGAQAAPPAIAMAFPPGDLTVRESALKVRGKVTGPGYVARVAVNGVNIPFDLARQEVQFERDLTLTEAADRIVVTAEDLLGNLATTTVTVTLDQEGPLIAIEDVVARTRDGRKYLLVTGQISDASGIRSVALNGRPVVTGNAAALPLALEQEDSPDGKLVIRAEDTLGNVTLAELDLPRTVAEFDGGPPVLVAFNGPGIFSSDREKPVIRLKDTSNLPDLYIDKYYLEGEVSDNSRVDRILVNGREATGKKGKKLFFSKLVDLKEGKNRISVTAYDSGGNLAEESFFVTRKIPAVMQQSSRMSLTVLPFDGKSRETTAQLAANYLMAALVEQKRFTVVERDKLEQVLSELKLAKAKLTDPKHALRIGRLLSADALVASSISDSGKSLEIVSRVINAETSEDMVFVDVFSEDGKEKSVWELMTGLAAKIARNFPMLEGIVVKADQAEVLSDLAGETGLHNGAGVIIYRRGPEIKHPATGRSLGFDTVTLAEGRIEEVRKGFSKARLLEKEKKQGIRAADLIITK